jgi:two-component system NtrC family sensor kinase
MSDILAKLLVVDDEPSFVKLCQRILSNAGYEVAGVSRGEEAVTLVRENAYDLLLTDIKMPQMDGFEVMRLARQVAPQMAIVVATGQIAPDITQRALQEGAQGLVNKPLASNQELITIVQTALERNRLSNENLRLKALLPLFKVTQTLLAEVDLARLYEQILDTVQRETRCDRVSLMLLDEPRQELFIAASRDLPEEFVKTAREKLGEGIAGWVAQYAQSVLLDPQSQVGTTLRDALHRDQVASALSVPLIVRGKVIGVLNATNLSQRRSFKMSDLELLTILAGQAAAALDNARLHERTRARTKEFQLLNEINSSISANLDLPQILNATIEGIRHLFDVEGVLVFWRAPTRQDFFCLYSIGDQPPQQLSQRLTLTSGLVGWVIAHGQPALAHDAPNDPRFNAELMQMLGLQPQAVLCVPLSMHMHTIGAIELINKHTSPFDTDDAEVLTALASSVSVAMANAQLLETIKRSEEKYRSLTANAGEAILLADRASLQILEANARAQTLTGLNENELQQCQLYDVFAQGIHHTLAVQIGRVLNGHDLHFDDLPLLHKSGASVPVSMSAQLIRFGNDAVLQLIIRDISHLRRMERQLSQSEKMAATGRLMASLAHEINNPLQAIQNCLALLMGRPMVEEKRQSYLQMANQEVERLIELTKRMLDFYRPSSEARVEVNLNTILDDVCALAAKRLQQDRVVLYRAYNSDVPPIQAIPNELKQVFLNLMLNAAQAMPNGGNLWVSTFVEQDGQWVVIEFKDTGVGIPPEDLPRLFEPFFSTKEEGTGLGLAVSYSIVARHGGRIEVESEVGKGSKFTVRLQTT